MKRLSKKIQNLCKEIRDIRNYSAVNSRIIQIQYINSVIMGIAEYINIEITREGLGDGERSREE